MFHFDFPYLDSAQSIYLRYFDRHNESKIPLEIDFEKFTWIFFFFRCDKRVRDVQGKVCGWWLEWAVDSYSVSADSDGQYENLCQPDCSLAVRAQRRMQAMHGC